MSSTPIVPYGPPATAGGTPAVTPPQGSFTQGDQPTVGGQPGAQSPDQLKQLLQMLMQKQQQPQLPQPVPAPIPEPKQQAQTGTGPSWGFERFANNIGSHIQQGIAQQKKTELAKAESDWNQLAAAMQSNNPAALQAIMTDQKKLKNMAKALNQDWLNPEKTTVYKQALDNVMRQQQAKGKAAQGLQSLMKKLIGKATQPNLTDQQKEQMGQEMLSKAPLQSSIDPKTMVDLYKSIGEEAYRDKSLGLDQQRVDIEKSSAETAAKRADIEDKRYAEDLKFKYDSLTSQKEDRAAVLSEKKASDQDRALALQDSFALRQQIVEISRERLNASLAGAGTPKERQTEWKNLFDDLDKRRADDSKTLDIANKAGMFARVTGSVPSKETAQDIVKRDNAASALARKLQTDVIAGRIDPLDAKNKVYSVYDQNTRIFSTSEVRSLALQNKVPVADLQKSLESKGAVVY